MFLADKIDPDTCPAEHLITIGQPAGTDGSTVHTLIANCPPLDTNSVYCNLLQCTHFADTCAIARHTGNIIGFVSAYIPPTRQDTLFVWQVAIHETMRGKGLGKVLIQNILGRETCRNVRYLQTTITAENNSSWRMFRSLAQGIGAKTTHTTHFERDAHFGGRHETEFMLTIGPFHIPQDNEP